MRLVIHILTWKCSLHQKGTIAENVRIYTSNINYWVLRRGTQHLSKMKRIVAHVRKTDNLRKIKRLHPMFLRKYFSLSFVH